MRKMKELLRYIRYRLLHFTLKQNNSVPFFFLQSTSATLKTSLLQNDGNDKLHPHALVARWARELNPTAIVEASHPVI